MKKSFIVEDVTANLDKITCLTDEIIEGINFRCLNAIGVWHVDGNDGESYSLTYNEQIEIRDQNLGVWEADNEDDMIDEITSASGWLIKNIYYEVQLK